MSKPSDASDDEARGDVPDRHGTAGETKAHAGGFLFFAEASESPEGEQPPQEPREASQLGEVRDQNRAAARPLASAGIGGGEPRALDPGVPRTDGAEAGRRGADFLARLDASVPGASIGVGRDRLTPYDFGMPRPVAPRIRSLDDEGAEPRAFNPAGPDRVVAGDEPDPFDAKASPSGKPASPRHLSYAAPVAGSGNEASASTGRAGEHDSHQRPDRQDRTRKEAAQVVTMAVVAVCVVVFGVQFAFLNSQLQRLEESELALKDATRQLAEMTEAVRSRNSSADASLHDGLSRLQPTQQMEAKLVDNLRDAIESPERAAPPELATTTFGTLGPLALSDASSVGTTRASDASSVGTTRAIVFPPIAVPSSDLTASLDRAEPAKIPVMPAGPALAPHPLGAGRSCRAPAPSTLAAAAEKPQGTARQATAHRRYADSGRSGAARARPDDAARDSAPEQCDPLP